MFAFASAFNLISCANKCQAIDELPHCHSVLNCLYVCTKAYLMPCKCLRSAVCNFGATESIISFLIYNLPVHLHAVYCVHGYLQSVHVVARHLKLLLHDQNVQVLM